MSDRARGSLIIALILGIASPASAECPTTPDDPVCRPWSAVLLPTLYGGLFAPMEGGTYFGGGFEAVLLAWSDNSEAFGPSQGRIRTAIGVLSSNDEMVTGKMIMYRTGAQVAFERNASRSYGIPYFAADFGGLWTEATGRRWFVDAGIGMYLVHRRSFILDVEVTGVVPFQDFDQLGGVTSRLALSFALW